MPGVFPPRFTFEFNIREKDDRKMVGGGAGPPSVALCLWKVISCNLN